MCGKCCKNREDVLLVPRDIYRMARELKMTPQDLVRTYCEVYIGNDSKIPLVRLNPRDNTKRCPFLSNGKCQIHNAKPEICALYPIGRAFLGEPSENKDIQIDAEKIFYIYHDVQCGDRTETHTVRSWLKKIGIPEDDEFFIIWLRTLLELTKFMHEVENYIDPSSDSLEIIWEAILTGLYLAYDPNIDFMPQFKKNTEKLLSLSEQIKTGYKILVKAKPLRPTATSVETLENYRLLVTFDNGEQRIYDVRNLIKGDWFGKLKDPDYFRTVHVAGLSVEWADGQDVCPDDLYDSSVPVKGNSPDSM
ncbi:MAG: DUF2442 domain-containing protein [Clostridiales bacterium]|nr:DUF2442 domain-containing protein [Clostridiales bacterium]